MLTLQSSQEITVSETLPPGPVPTVEPVPPRPSRLRTPVPPPAPSASGSRRARRVRLGRPSYWAGAIAALLLGLFVGLLWVAPLLVTPPAAADQPNTLRQVLVSDPGLSGGTP